MIKNKVEEIYNKKINLIKNKKEKIELSKYEDIIPMYDIYSEKVYPINKNNLYYRLIDCHYRFITEDIKKWIENKYKKYKKKNNKDNLNIIANYDLDTLLKTSYRVLYEYSTNLGLHISICKRNSFNKYSKHLIPYYSKIELIKLGKNMGIIEKETDINLNNMKTHYMICKKISKNDISAKEIITHNNFIVENKLISSISNYSFMGSYFMNRYLRNQSDTLSSNLLNTIKLLGSMIIKSPSLNQSYYLYRFIWNDDFIKKLNIGEYIIDNGFISTTRDPFYSPGVTTNFGLILIKIKIPALTGTGLLIENFSLFPKEEEFLLPLNSKLKLISKNDNFKYYHTNKQFEKIISKKYEFEFIESSYKNITFNKKKEIYEEFNIIENEYFSKIEQIKHFILLNKTDDNTILIKIKDNNINEFRNYKINYNWFDGTDSYASLYHNKTRNGMNFIIYDEYMNPYINIEFGELMVVNNLNKFYYYDDKRELDETDFTLLNKLAYSFSYGKYILYLIFNNFSKVSKIEDIKLKSYLYSELYCHSYYEYFKNNKKFYSNIEFINNYIKYNLGYWKLSKLKDTMLPNKIFEKFSDIYKTNITVGDFFIDIIENHFYYYSKLQNLFINYDLIDIFDKQYIEVDVESYYKSKNKQLNKVNIPYDNSIIENNKDFKLIFRQPIRRII